MRWPFSNSRTRSSAAAWVSAQAVSRKNRDGAHLVAVPAFISGRARCGRFRCLCPACEKLVTLAACFGGTPGLDVSVAADLLGQRGDLDCERRVVARQSSEQPFDRLLVLADQRPFGAPLVRAAKRVERGPPQALEFRKPAH